MPSTITPNMSLIVPTTGSEPGPTYANDINASLNTIDAHNHAPGSGVAINPSGISINADLAFNGNNATTMRTVRFTPQSVLTAPADIGCIYESGVDLYYNDGSGNNVRITQGGSVAAPSGSITGLVSPASAVYTSGNQTFTWQSAVNTPANLDAASIVLRNLVALSNGLTLSPPAALASNYTITLPTLPSATSFMRIDSSGNITKVAMYDIVVGTGGDYATIGAAIAAASAGQSIFIIKGTYTENVTVNKQLNIYGSGRGTIISGSLTFATSSDDSLMEDFKVTSNVTINSGVSEVTVQSFWNGSASTVTDNGDGSFLQYMQE